MAKENIHSTATDKRKEIVFPDRFEILFASISMKLSIKSLQRNNNLQINISYL